MHLVPLLLREGTRKLVIALKNDEKRHEQCVGVSAAGDAPTAHRNTEIGTFLANQGGAARDGSPFSDGLFETSHSRLSFAHAQHAFEAAFE